MGGNTHPGRHVTSVLAPDRSLAFAIDRDSERRRARSPPVTITTHEASDSSRRSASRTVKSEQSPEVRLTRMTCLKRNSHEGASLHPVLHAVCHAVFHAVIYELCSMTASNSPRSMNLPKCGVQVLGYRTVRIVSFHLGQIGDRADMVSTSVVLIVPEAHGLAGYRGDQIEGFKNGY